MSELLDTQTAGQPEQPDDEQVIQTERQLPFGFAKRHKVLLEINQEPALLYLSLIHI